MRLESLSCNVQQNHWKSFQYIHKPIIARHIGDNKSSLNWCKNQILENEVANSEATNLEEPSTSSGGKQLLMNLYWVLLLSMKIYFKVFCLLLKRNLYLVNLNLIWQLSETLDLNLGLLSSIVLLVRQWQIFLCHVVKEMVKEFFGNSHFISLFTDAGNASKTFSKKPWFLQRFFKGYFHFVLCALHLRCQSSKEFGRGTSEGTFKAMKDAFSICFWSVHLQAHTLKDLANSLRNLLVALLFVENVEKQGSGVGGVNSITTKKCILNYMDIVKDAFTTVFYVKLVIYNFLWRVTAYWFLK